MAQTRPSQARLAYLDTLRGFAMLGIMFINFPSINTVAGDEAIAYSFVNSQADKVVAFLSMNLFNGKVYPIFAFLFGIGLFIFISNIKKSGINSGVYLVRRLFFLIVFGLLHACFVWWGDILMVYGILGFVALPFLNKPRWFLISALLGLLFFIPSFFIAYSSLQLQGVIPTFLIWDTGYQHLNGLDYLTSVYGSGTFAEISVQRIRDYIYVFTPFLYEKIYLKDIFSFGVYYCQILGMFFLGYFTAMHGLHKKIDLFQEKIKGYGLVFLSSAFLILASIFYFDSRVLSSAGILINTFIALFYICLLTLCGYRLRYMQLMFAPIGRMSFTAYLSHTLFFSSVLYGYGLGLYGSVGPAVLLPVSVVFYFLMLLFSYYWLKNFKFGPAEWVWKSLTYWKIQPMALKEMDPSAVYARKPKVEKIIKARHKF